MRDSRGEYSVGRGAAFDRRRANGSKILQSSAVSKYAVSAISDAAPRISRALFDRPAGCNTRGMTDTSFNATNPLPARRDFIDGISNYCDRWCERCRFQSRCSTRAIEVRLEQVVAAGATPDEDQVVEDVLGPTPPAPPWMAEIFEAKLTPEESARIDTVIAAQDVLSEKDPAVLAAREYSRLAYSLARTLRSDSRILADPVLSTAMDTISWHALSIRAKTSRAVHGLIGQRLEPPGPEDDDWREDPVQNDANGSAKLCRLIVAESLAAWESLMHAGQADGVPAVMIKRLAELDALLAKTFPRAMEFIRPGFDEDTCQE